MKIVLEMRGSLKQEKNRMKKVLFVLGNYMPTPSANGICVDEIRKDFITQGVETFSLSCRQIKKQKNTTNDFFIKTPFLYRTLHNISNEGLIRKIFVSILRIIRNIETVICYPFVNFSFKHKLYRKIDSLYKKYHFDVIVSVSYPRDAAYATFLFKKKHPDVKCVSYSLDPFVDERKHNHIKNEYFEKKAFKFEKQIVNYHDLVIVKKEHFDHYDLNYHDEVNKKVFFLGVPLFIKRNLKKRDINKIIAVYAGSLWPDLRDPSFIINLFKQSPDYELHIYTNASKSWLETLSDNVQNIKIFEPVCHEDLNQIFEQANILVNIGNSIDNAYPSKLIEYISYGKPIITTYKHDKDECKDIVERFSFGLALDEKKKYNNFTKDVMDMLNNYSLRTYDELKNAFWEYTPEAVTKLVLRILE